jgi:hypothetical protein
MMQIINKDYDFIIWRERLYLQFYTQRKLNLTLDSVLIILSLLKTANHNIQTYSSSISFKLSAMK